MPTRFVNCPNCGGQVQFKAGTSLLSVCPYCSSAVARVGGDIGELEILGKVAPLAPIGSPLSVGTRGKHRGVEFTLVGRLQLDYGAGPWNEWYAAFEDERWGWVAEAQGRVYLTFGREVADLPPFSSWRVGTRFSFHGQPLAVVERRHAKFVSAEGELPHAVRPGADLYYCDVQGPNGVFGTLDFGEDRQLDAVYLGEQLEYEALFGAGITKDLPGEEAAAAVGLNCPSCGAGVELRAPDEAQRVVCGSCSALLDCKKGNELYLLQSAVGRGPEPRIPLGSMGRYKNATWTVVGFLVRSVTVDFVVYAWDEYLLHAPGRGYRWLVSSNDHWMWMDPVNAGDVEILGLNAHLQDKKFRHFQSAVATVNHLKGEFYWKVAVGDKAAMTDWVAPPLMLSRERSDDEDNWSIGQYLDKSVLEQLFKLKTPLPRPHGVAPSQPNPGAASQKSLLGMAALFSVILVALGLAMAVFSDNRLVYSAGLPLTDLNPGNAESVARSVTLSEPFEIGGHTNLAVRLSADVTNTWFALSGALINETTQEVRSFVVDVGYWAGSTGGESWSEGSRKRTIYVGSIEPGTYVLRLQPELDPSPGVAKPTYYDVEARADVFLPSHVFVALFALWIIPVLGIIRYWTFEKRRWAESDHAS